jgi:hypothetical protein
MKQPPAPVWLNFQRPPRSTGGGVGGGGGGAGAAAVSGGGGLVVQPASAARSSPATTVLIAGRPPGHAFLKLLIAFSQAEIAYQKVPNPPCRVRARAAFTSWSE